MLIVQNFSDGGVIVVEDDPDIIHFDNSSDLLLSTSLNDLDNATLHIDGQSTEVDVPPDIIDVIDEDDDIIDDEDALPYDLDDSDDEDLINVDDDDVARSHDGDGGGEDRPLPHYVPSGCGGCFANRGKGKRKPSLGGRVAGRLNTRDKTRNLSLKEITDTKAPSRSGLSCVTNKPVCLSIHAGVQQHLQKAYNTNKAAFKAQHWDIDPTTGTYNVEKIRRARPKDITVDEWDKYIQFWNDPRNIARAAQNRQNRAKSTVISRQGSWSLARLRDEMEEMRRLEATGTYTDDEINRLARGGKQRGHILGVGRVLLARATASPSTPAHESTLNSLHKMVDFMIGLFKSDSKYSDMFSQFESGGASGSGGCRDDEEGADEDEDGDDDT
uniref:F-box domain, leucine-rich repeat domain, L domain-like protein n=1 Tax=Tanacetum cinerariifolium TaxID=118510 RepID=A0A6L2KP04_TANCI|nr:F-box domain, leucine-rich repeat domain, L domain-like protein [Tanacetum cinerariifolium]